MPHKNRKIPDPQLEKMLDPDLWIRNPAFHIDVDFKFLLYNGHHIYSPSRGRTCSGTCSVVAVTVAVNAGA